MSLRRLKRRADFLDGANFMVRSDECGFVYGETFYNIVTNRKTDYTLWHTNDFFREWFAERGCKQIFVQDRSRRRNYKISITDFYNKAILVGKYSPSLYVPLKYWSRA